MNQNSAGNLPDMSTRTIAFIGGGNMAGSLIGGLVADGYSASKICASDTDREKLASLSARFGIRSASDNLDAVRRSDVVVLAVKPQAMEKVAKNLANAIQQFRPLVISIAAGVREAHLRKWLGSDVALIRTMPNTPAMLQAGATVLHAGAGITRQQRSIAETILRSVGLTCWVEDEALMDAVTALSGSGPAYFSGHGSNRASRNGTWPAGRHRLACSRFRPRLVQRAWPWRAVMDLPHCEAMSRHPAAPRNVR